MTETIVAAELPWLRVLCTQPTLSPRAQPCHPRSVPLRDTWAKHAGFLPNVICYSGPLIGRQPPPRFLQPCLPWPHVSLRFWKAVSSHRHRISHCIARDGGISMSSARACSAAVVITPWVRPTYTRGGSGSAARRLAGSPGL